MNINTNYDPDLEDEEMPYTHTKGKAEHSLSGQRKPPKKSSYESSADVQRWLQEQALAEEHSIKPEFNPTLIASRRDAPWILSSLAHFYEHDLITDVLHVVKSGKEATVFCCAAHPSTGVEYLAAKVYRPRMFRSLKNDAIYRQSRVLHDEDGQVVRGSRRKRNAHRKSERGRATQVRSWIEHEFETQSLLHAAGADVPQPLSQIGNAILMEYIGDLDNPAPMLREVALPPEEAQSLFECVIHNIELCLANNRIHGDLSEYNILYWHGTLTLIDFAQSVDPRYNPQVFSVLLRDIERICRYFARYSVKADQITLATDIWTTYLGAFS